MALHMAIVHVVSTERSLQTMCLRVCRCAVGGPIECFCQVPLKRLFLVYSCVYSFIEWGIFVARVSRATLSWSL